MLIFLKLVIYGITATVAGLALRFLWKHLKDQRIRLLEAYWRPVRVGLLVFAVWILWELFWLIRMETSDRQTWLDALEVCRVSDANPDIATTRNCGFNAHLVYFPYLLALSILKAAVAGMLAASLLIIDPVVIRILTVARGDTDKKTPPKQTLRERIANSIKSTRVSVSNKKKGIANNIKSTRDSVSNMGKKVVGFRPGNIFRRRKKDDQPTPSVEKKPPADDPKEQ